MRRTLSIAATAALILSSLAVPATAQTPDPANPVIISELHYDNAGADTGEAIEVFGPAGTSLDGWSLVLYNGATTGSTAQRPYHTTVLSGSIADQCGGYGVVVAQYPVDGIQNGSPDAVALVDAAGTVVQFLSYEGTMTAVDGPADGLTSTDIGESEASSAPVGSSLKIAGPLDALTWTASSDHTFGAVQPIEVGTDCGDGGEPGDPEVTKIHDVQGAGAASPKVGQTLTVEGIVVGDHEGASPKLSGFFVQEEDADADADPRTSEGVFVYNASAADTVELGDKVRVTATVAEFNTYTELTRPTTTVISQGNPLPAPATITFPVNAVSDLEAYEGMVATFPQQLVIAEYFNFDRYGEIVVALPAEGEDFPMTPTALFAPDDPAASARADLNLRSRITVDDGISAQNVTVTHPITREPLTIDTMFRGGDTVTGLTGPVFYDFGLYRVLPYSAAEAEAAYPGYTTYHRTDASPSPAPVGGSVSVAWLNTLNYFTTIGATCSPSRDQDCRGADDAGELTRQRTKLLTTLVGLDADVYGLGELENTPGVEVLADLVAGLNDRLGAGTYAFIAAGENGVVGTDAIKVGIIYRPSAVTPVGTTAILDAPEFLNPNHTIDPATGQPVDRNRASIAQSFRENATGEVFSVSVNHLKSKGSTCGPTEPVNDPLVGSCNTTRTIAAQVLSDWLATSPTQIADDDWLILGDLNAYDHETPITTFAGNGFADLVREAHGDYAYSYVYDGQAGYLDYALGSASVLGQVAGVSHWNINADEPDIIDYDTSFKSAAQAALFDPSTPYRSSDHDPVLVGLMLGSGIVATASPNTLWPPNHKLVPITVKASDGSRTRFSVKVVSATSSEPDARLGRGDVPHDIVISAGALKLRAERFSRKGRTYTVAVVASGGGQVTYTTATVTVPHDKGGGHPKPGRPGQGKPPKTTPGHGKPGSWKGGSNLGGPGQGRALSR
ncbi:MAG: ExeM/NucH family extracellular endonuclease [Propionicimonas sp.]|uniref:ExeM/NucH family extracellular endonuclease n=1 Tax=Propionicimonas sp. TaxID=1955623 RepID=UPI002B20D2C3|nr:ExeM/NucH family extracellular endonuclease [Propionicimonas sp.]MEA4945881.1 ExeM/NucH family extracellular endonuclease [Propionicimonas sp.]